ncbi:major facilitator superfamily-domain-containing protein [Dendryphion nanum]|uniref:Major facilitator superfamily-domain-containing protein n=1 Tax=Dendryphion nanum TaxID=256645 RepID=A0A9P9IKF5_9PLEO|nr:major facilitator superfamily-domain-containing protein [Dendryphion nanum]
MNDFKPPASLRRHDTSSTAHDGDSSEDNHDNGVTLHRTKSIAEQMSPMREFLFVGILCSAQFTTQAGLANTLTILHVLGPELNITNEGVLSWLIAGYSLTVGSFILLSGRMGDMFGYKRMLVIGFVWFGIWNIIAGCAGYSDAVLFIFARVLQGIGPAILLPNALGLLGATYENGKKKDMVFCLFGACAPGGAVIGGLFASLWSFVWWPWTYWTFGIALLLIAIAAVLILPFVSLKPEVQSLSLKQKIVDLDLLGAAVGITAMILFNFAWNQAPGFGWERPYIYVLLIIGVLLFPVFFWIELKISPMPLIPFDTLSMDVGFVLGCVSCGWAAFEGIWIYYFFQFLQIQRGDSPLLSTAHVCAVAVSGFVAAITTGKVISRIGPQWVMLISMAAFLTGSILTATAPVDQSYWAQTFVTVLIIPWGMDMSFPAGTLIVSDSVKKEHQGMGASLVNTVVNYSISIGVGIAGTVDVHTNNGGRTKEDILTGYRNALYLGVALSGLGICIAFMFLLKSFVAQRKKEADISGKNEKVVA